MGARFRIPNKNGPLGKGVDTLPFHCQNKKCADFQENYRKSKSIGKAYAAVRHIRQHDGMAGNHHRITYLKGGYQS